MRGSCPCSGAQYVRYGGNTACASVQVGEEPPIVFDLGTGLRPLGHELEERYGDTPVELTAFLTHIHWDHIIGLPFCRPVLRLGGTLEVFGPPQDGKSLTEVMDRVVVPPYFPVKVDDLSGSVSFTEVSDDVIAVGSAKVTVRRVPHVGTTLGFRVEAEGCSVAYVSDHQAPSDGCGVDDAVLELCDGVDLAIHDAQYTEEEFAAKATWGHSTFSYAVHVAAESGARKLALFHHDPVHGDEEMDRLLDETRTHAEAARLDGIVAAAEGTSLDLARR